ncbi:MAG TPA: DUF427 domain-containing protein [Jatrophihabitantaceae bacterium]|jgi:uncharacterized protein (DUF427 family)
MTHPVKVPGPEHPITVERTGERVRVLAGDRVVADTKDALTLREGDYPPVQYIPLSDVNPEVIRRTDSHTYCPYKGEASYYSIVADGGEIADAIWTYEQPYPAVAEIAGHVAFYPNRVEIAVG